VRVIAGLDQPPILFHSEAWPLEAGEHLARLRAAARCEERDALVVVWGPERDVHTAADEIRLRYVDATDGIPNETRQPFPDGHTDFERILPGPNRMYPDTDSPPIRVTRERVGALRSTLAPPPWTREKRYGEAGVPKDTVFFLIRRGGAALVDRVVAECGADLRRACFFFGEKLKGLRRKGIQVDAVPLDRWCELFRFMGERPVLWEAWSAVVSALAASPLRPMGEIVEEAGLNARASGWKRMVAETVTSRRPDHGNGDVERQARFYMGRIMPGLRGKVPAAEVLGALRASLGDRAGSVTEGRS
jgi:glutamyl-tRNA(Gln) amidotransferase subunit E